MFQNFNLPSGSEPVKNIVLVGRTGNGKSATGNSIIKRDVFESETQATGVTMKCQTFRAVIQDGPIINVIDTPGLFDLSASAGFISNEIVNCLSLAEEGLHAVVLVLSVRNRITQEEENILCTLQVLFGSRILDYLIVLFTGGDELESNQKTLENYLAKCPEFLTTVLRLCGHRKVLFNNRTKDERQRKEQVHQLLAYVAAVELNTNGIPFTGRIHSRVKAETSWLREQQSQVDEDNSTSAEIAKMRLQFELSHQKNMLQIAQMVEQLIRPTPASGSQENVMYALNDLRSRMEQNERLRIEQNKKSCNIL